MRFSMGRSLLVKREVLWWTAVGKEKGTFYFSVFLFIGRPLGIPEFGGHHTYFLTPPAVADK
jgi:hypothetical protein